MAFTFIHTADWHIGKAFGRFDAEKASVLRRARLTAVDRLADVARRHGAHHVLVAGDVYDGAGLADRVIDELVATLHGHDDLSWHLLPGNHDPDEPGGVWDRASRHGLPAHVHVHRSAKVSEIARGVVLLPAPCASRHSAEDPTRWMDGQPTAQGLTRIGLAHGPTRHFGADGGPTAPIDPQRVRTAGLDYLALGDWHGKQEVVPAVWYAGTPEPEQFADNAPGHALVVQVAGQSAPPVVSAVATAEFTWARRRIAVRFADDLEPVAQELDAAGRGARQILLRLDLEGRLALSQMRALQERLDRIDAHVFHLERRVARLVTRLADEDRAMLEEVGLGRVAAQLSAIASDQAHPRRPEAERAIERLYSFARGAAPS